MTTTAPQEQTRLPRTYLRPREITEVTGASLTKIYSSLHNGDLRGSRIGRTWIVHVDDLKRWIEDASNQKEAGAV